MPPNRTARGVADNFTGALLWGCLAIGLAPSQGTAVPCLDFAKAPRVVGGLPPAVVGRGLEVEAVNSMLYLLAAPSGYGWDTTVRVVDVAEPGSPVLRGSLGIPNPSGLGFAASLRVSGGYAYFSAGVDASGQKLYVVDVATPNAPEIVAAVSLPGRPKLLDVVPPYLYASLGNLVVVDISNPVAPSVIAELPLPGGGFAMRVSGGFAYVSTRTRTYVVDVRDPALPILVRTIEGMWFTDMHAAGDRALLAGIGLTVLDLSDPSFPVVLGSTAEPYLERITMLGDMPLGTAPNGISQGGKTYESWGRVAAFDVASPATPWATGYLPIVPDARDVATTGGIVWVADGRAGLVGVEAPGAGSLAPPADADLSSRGNSLAAGAETAYCSTFDENTGFGHLDIVDLSDPAGPVVAASLPFPIEYHVRHLAMSGTALYLATSGQVAVADVADPHAPVVLSTLDVEPSNLVDLAAAGSRALAVDRRYGNLLVIDAADPGAPVLAGSMGMAARSVAAAGNYAYVGCAAGLGIVDVTGPDPVIVGFWDEPVMLSSVAVAGDRVCAVEYPNGRLHVFDVTVREKPQRLATLDLPDERTASTVSMHGHCAYLAGGSGGVHAVDLSVPSTPTFLGSAGTHDLPEETLPIAGALAVLAVRDLAVLPLQCRGWTVREELAEPPLAGREPGAGAVSLGLVHPNPSRGTTGVDLFLAVPSRLRIAVYDVQGRAVSVLRDGPAAPGRHRAEWSGRDGSGRPAGPGVYFLSLETDRERLGRTLVRIR